ncbi:MAG: DUF1624 domain-containing protein [Anaerolineales bacterium]|nr:DUF1624 domain-containing protein [Anaerolineales bacterium]
MSGSSEAAKRRSGEAEELNSPILASSPPHLLAPSPSPRLWEVDTLRGVAIVLMLIYHFTWDLVYFGLYQANLLAGPWQWFARGIATIFIFVMGISLTLSDTRERRRLGQPPSFKKYLGRGGKIFGLGLLVTVGTYFFIGRGFVIFGILHLLGLSIILAYPFLRSSPWVNLVAGLVVIVAGIYVDRLVVSYPWLIWLGVKQAGIYMVDYYPVLPWFGLSLLGIFAGYSLYPQGVRHFALPNLAAFPLVRGLRFLGRHSLLIYVIHQPILIGLLVVLGFGSF